RRRLGGVAGVPLGTGLQLSDLGRQHLRHGDELGDQIAECGVLRSLVPSQDFFSKAAEIIGHIRVLQHSARSMVDLRAPRANSYQEGGGGYLNNYRSLSS